MAKLASKRFKFGMTAEENSRHCGAVVNEVSCCCLIVFRACAHRWLSTTTVQNESWQAGLQSARCRRRIERDDDEVDVTMLMFVLLIRVSARTLKYFWRAGERAYRTRRHDVAHRMRGKVVVPMMVRLQNNVDMTRLGYSAGMIPTDPNGFKVSEAVPMLKDGPTM